MSQTKLSTELASDSRFIAFLENTICSVQENLEIDFEVVALSLYGSVVKGKLNPNDIDVFAEIAIYADAEMAYELGFELDEDSNDDEESQCQQFLADHIHSYLHGEFAGFKQPAFNGVSVDICVKLMSCEEYLDENDVFIQIETD